MDESAYAGNVDTVDINEIEIFIPPKIPDQKTTSDNDLSYSTAIAAEVRLSDLEISINIDNEAVASSHLEQKSAGENVQVEGEYNVDRVEPVDDDTRPILAGPCDTGTYVTNTDVACVEINSQSLDSWPQSNDSLKQSLLSTGSDSSDGVSDSHSVKRLSLTGNAAINNLFHDENHVSIEQSGYGTNRDEEKTVDNTCCMDDSHENSSSRVSGSSADVSAAYVTNSEIAQEITDKNAEKAAAYENRAIIDASKEICNMVDNDLYNSYSNKP